MLQGLEKLVLSAIHWFFSFPGITGVMTLGPIAAVLLVIQFQKQGKTVFPGLSGVFFAALAILHYFWPQIILNRIQLMIDSIGTASASRTPVPIVEPLFNIMVGHYSRRNAFEEAVAAGLLVYIGLVVYYAIYKKEEIIPGATTGSIWEMFKNERNRPERSKSNELGSGDFASQEQIAKWIKPSGDIGDTKLHVEGLRGSGGTLFRKAELYIPREQRNRHVLAVAKTGSGKTTKLILPFLYNDCLDPDRSTIVIDSKPEMWRKLAAMTRKYNPDKEILLFNPLDTARSLSWNILSKIETDTDAKLIANTVIQATDNPAAKADSPFFRNNALQILNAIMVGLLHDENETLSMPRIHELVQSGNKNLADWLRAHPHSIKTTRTFCDLVKSGSQNADTIMSELGMRLAAWDLQAIRATTSLDELDPEVLVSKPTLFIVELRESELEMLRPMANVIVTELLRFLTKRAESCQGVSLPRPVSIVIDEFASALGRVPDIHVKLNTLRSRNVSIVAAVQSLAQINANYQDDAESVIAGFSTKIFMPTLDISDAEWASKESGQMTVRFQTQSSGSNRKIIEVFASRNDSMQEQVQQRPVLTPDEIGRPVDNISTFFFPNTPVFQGFLVPFYQVPEMLNRITEFDSDEGELHLRDKPIEIVEKLPEVETESAPAAAGAAGGARPGITNTKGWDDDKIRAKLEEVKVKLEWEKTTGSARKWWLAFENENKHRLGLVLRLAEELAVRKATITEFFLAYVYSNTDNIQANLSYLDYTRLKREEEKKKRAARAEAAKKKAASNDSHSGSAATPSGSAAA